MVRGALPTLPPATHVLADRLAARREDLARRMVARYRQDIPDYRLADEDMVLADVLAVSLENVDVLVASLRQDEPADATTLGTTRSRAAIRVRQGIALESFLHAARLWGEVLWDEVMAAADPSVPEEREAALAIAGRVIRHIDLLSTSAAEGYLSVAQGIWTEREVVRRDLLDGLVAGQGATDRVRRLAAGIGIALAETYVVVVLRTQAPPEDTDVAARPLVEAVRRALGALPGGPALVGVRHGDVVALCPGSAEDVRRAATALAEGAPDAVIGIGGAHSGPTGTATSYQEATDAAQIAADTGVRGRPVRFDEVLVDHVVRSSPHAGRILDASVRPLVDYDAARQAELVATLRTYVASGFNLARSAEQLCVHANTVAYRLRRVHELTGRDPHDPDDLLLLVLGLRLADQRSSL